MNGSGSGGLLELLELLLGFELDDDDDEDEGLDGSRDEDEDEETLVGSRLLLLDMAVEAGG